MPLQWIDGECEEEEEVKIVFLESDNLGSDMDFDQFSRLGEVTIYKETAPEEIAERIADADAVIVNKLMMDETSLKNASHIRYIGITATGKNNIDFDYTKSRGICVTNVAGYSTDVVAQHTFAMTLYLLEHLRYYDEYVKSGEYTKSRTFCHMDRRFYELSGKTWGILGLGAIGSKVAQIAETFGCSVIFYSPSGTKREEKYRQVDFETLLAQSDILSVHAPLTEKTHHLMDYEAFSKMKDSSIFINVGRGPIVEEQGLCRALTEGKIAAAGLDVLEHEPMDKDSPLRRLADSDALLITPHIAWAAVEARKRLLDEVWENIAAFQRGEKRNVCE